MTGIRSACSKRRTAVGVRSHKYMLRTNMTPNMTPYTMEKLPELN